MPFYLLLLLLQLPAVWGERNPDGTNDVETEIRRIESKLRNLEMPQPSRSVIREDPFIYLQHLESMLTETQFQGLHKRFGRSKIFANVHKIVPETLKKNLSIEEIVQDVEINQFQVTLSKTVLAKAKGAKVNQEGRVVMLAATSPVLFQDNDSHPILGGKVIGISVGNTTVHGLLPKERISITFWHNQRNFTPWCVFWVMGAKPGDIGKWNTSGCEVKHRGNQTTCLCDHLTFFAVLMLPSSDIDKVHQEYLNIVSYVGCIISALASFITIVFLCLRKKQRDHIVYVHMNLLWAIFLLDMSFLIAVYVALEGGDIACKASGIFLHFAMLACLTWMGIEGYNLYRLVIQVFNSYMKCLLVKLSLIGWGLPTLIICLIFGIDQSYYGLSSFKVYESPGNYTISAICWITKMEINSFLNLGYLSLVFLFNSIMLTIMVYEILRLKHQKRHWGYVVMLLGLSCVLGIPWGLVFFAIASETFKLVAVYLFTIINCLQGFFIFLWYLAKVWQSRRSNSMQCTSSNSLKLQSSNSSI
ncbi:adhesion G-protein coupled receptor G1-like isoform X1 [Pantherophis guttatus]|uniref:Adhesion G-protein coupled receptor G1-like isoform X1 n=1 Tax=Pantherophis guttatus TaxID=94885 RepID=A0ABM3ZGY0_PANGU|nr:adhesion G-protein coupled receptor G1-like isoform X1 [Pantherophis guttatus]